MAGATTASALDLSYVLPLRWHQDQGIDELAAYLRRLGLWVEDIVVVDGSPPPLFAHHADRLAGLCRHIRPDPALRFLMGKVNGVTTGVREARLDKVVVADDDVRYDHAGLARISAELEVGEIVRPQNYFRPLTWHARWDTARSLLNRVFSGDLSCPAADFPGTLGIRRGLFLELGGYDGDVIFENLELIRTVRAAGGRERAPLDLYVARRPPSTRHFLSQRVRQAYDDFALPLRMGFFLALVPLLTLAVALWGWPALAVLAIAAIAVAEVGRRRAGGARVFPTSGAVLAPAWLAERAVTSWLAVGQRLVRGGVRYGDVVIPTAAHSQREIVGG
ncbi:MAG: hypothetical protein QOG26_1009 [Solirubrobacterales bacterium]|nr:hypothetical protein [Solirubrobacterales bacterium]